MSFLEELRKLEDILVRLIEAADRLLVHPNNHPKGEPEQQILNKFKQGELLAHSLAYSITPDHKTVKVQDEDGIEREYVVRAIPTDNQGLVSFVLYDLNPSNPRIHVMFRGTHNIASGIRDIEESKDGGPGFASFKRNEQVILSSVSEVIAAKSRICDLPLELNVAGHSLGGADTQLFTRFFLNAMATPAHQCYGAFNKIKNLNVMHANSAGVTKETTASSDASLKIVNRENPQFKVNQYIIHFGGDLVQQSGYGTVFANAKYPQVNTYMLKGDAGQEGLFAQTIVKEGLAAFKRGLHGTYVAHTQMVFAANNPQSGSKDVTFRIYHNANPKDAEVIDKSLSYKALQHMGLMFNAFAALRELGNTLYSYWDNIIHNKPKNRV